MIIDTNTMELRDHQKEITVDDNTSVVRVLVPTGGGKTMCMIQDAKVAIQYAYTTDYSCCCS